MKSIVSESGLDRAVHGICVRVMDWLNSGDRVAQLVELRTRDPTDSMTRVRTPSGAQEELVSFSESKMMCGLAVSVPNPPQWGTAD